MGRPPSRGARARGDRGGPELRAHVCDAIAADEDRSARCADADGGVSPRRVSAGAIACRTRGGTCAPSWRCAKRWCGHARGTSRSRRRLVRRDGLRVASGEAHLVAKRIAALELSDTLARRAGAAVSRSSRRSTSRSPRPIAASRPLAQADPAMALLATAPTYRADHGECDRGDGR